MECQILLKPTWHFANNPNKKTGRCRIHWQRPVKVYFLKF